MEYLKYLRCQKRFLLLLSLQKLKTDSITAGMLYSVSLYYWEPRCCLFHGKIPAEVGKIKIDGFIWQAKNNELRFSTVSSFKGLESKIVILMDVDAFVDEQRRLLHYVAISRACTALYVFYDASAEDERQIMLAKGYLKLVQ